MGHETSHSKLARTASGRVIPRAIFTLQTFIHNVKI